MASRSIQALVATIVAILVMACGGGDGTAAETASPTPDEAADAYMTALAELTIEDLPALVLPQSDYGLINLGMEISSQSGPTDNEDVVDDFETIEVSVDDIDRLGRLGGYALAFENQTFEEGRIIQVDTWVELFSDSNHIDEYFELGFEDLRASDGIGGFELLELEAVEIPQLDGAEGWTVRALYPGLEAPISWTFGIVHHHQLLAGASVFEFGEGSRVPEVIGILEQLDLRIRGALDGSIEVSVDHVLPVTDDDREVPAPVGGPDLAAMTLTPDDLGPGWRLDEDGYYADPDRLALFTRDFKYTEPGAAILGGSEIGGLQAEVQLWPDAERAAAFVSSRRTLFEGEAGAANYARMLADDGGPTVTNVATKIRDLPYGDQALAVTIAADWSTLGRQTYLYIAIRDGDIVSWTTIDTLGSLNPADVDLIVERAAARLLTPEG